MTALRGTINELHPSQRMVALTGDDDNLDWQGGSGGGLEVYLIGGDGSWTLLTPGSGMDCGGGSWPREDSLSSIYRWSSDPDLSTASSETGLADADLGGLGPQDLLPEVVFLAVHTGGGVAFGWDSEVIRVR
jgi:hypothetical protein